MVLFVAYSPDGRHIISGSDDMTIRVWDAETGAAIGKPLEGSGGAWCFAHSPDGPVYYLWLC
jgi:WD40 repeat protein